MTLLLQLLLCAGVSPAPTAPQDGAPTATSAEETDRRPSVHLGVDGALTEWLVVRLLADGYPLAASPEEARVELSVRPSEEAGWVVTATGASTVTFQVEAAADPAVTRLELLHRSLDALEDVEPNTAVDPPAATVALSVAEEASPELAAQVAADILAAGATLVPAGSDAQLQVCAEGRPGSEGARISVIDGGADCATTEEPGAGVFDAVHFASTTQRVEAAIAELHAEETPTEPTPVEPTVEPPPRSPEKDDERPPGLEPEPPSRVVTPDGRSPPILRGGVAFGMLARITNIDPVFLGSAMIGREPGLQGWLEFHVRPATVTGPLTIVEVFPAVGVQSRPVAVGRFAFIAGGLVGADVHRWQLRAQGSTTQGTDVSLSGELMLGVAIAVWKVHEVQLSFRAGGSPERVHTFDGEEIWSRHPLRVGLTAGFMFGRKLGA